MREDPLSAIAKKHPPCTREKFFEIRGVAVHQYNHLESNFIVLFEHGTGARGDGWHDHRRSHISKFTLSKITSSIPRNVIMKEIVKTYYPEYNRAFIKTLFKEISEIDLIRNRIVHWSTDSIQCDDGIRVRLTPPLTSYRDDECIYIDDVVKFINKARFCCHNLSALICAVANRSPTWISEDLYKRVIRSPATFPPPADHPLSSLHQQSLLRL